MPLQLIRPQLESDKREELKNYLRTLWQRSKSGRSQQVDADYVKWAKAYEGTPLEEIRTVPFYKASNFVVKLIRIFIDTFVARTQNIVFATKPLYVVEGMPQDLRTGYELYLNRKALQDWNHYWLFREMLSRGNRNGTVVFKSPWVEKTTLDIMPSSSDPNGFTETPWTYFKGPDCKPIPFEDFYIYPITANSLCDAEVIFHRTRYVEEAARRMIQRGEWHIPDDKTVDTYLQHPSDVKRNTQQADAGVVDPYVREVKIVEAHISNYAITNDESKFYNIVVLFEEFSGDVFDCYFNPYPKNLCIFQDYRPFPREDFFYGESLCQILGQSQEEASRIHNERRDNSTIASSVVFKRKNGSLLPNPSTNWYPGKVWDLDDMDDLEVVEIGRNFTDMIQQEDYTFNLSEKLSGIGDVMQASSIGAGGGKPGVYNTQGTLSVMAEGNQRQDTNIRDARQVLGMIALTSSRLQAFYDPNDPLVDDLPAEAQESCRAALKYIAQDKSRYLKAEVKTSNAGANAEVEKANLMAVSQVLGQYGQTVQGLAQQLLNQQLNPGLRIILNDVVKMQRGMAIRLLKAYNEWDAIDDLPDPAKAIESVIPGGSRGTSPSSGGGSQSPMDGGAAQGAAGVPSRQLLESLAALPSAPQRQNGQGGLG